MIKRQFFIGRYILDFYFQNIDWVSKPLKGSWIDNLIKSNGYKLCETQNKLRKGGETFYFDFRVEELIYQLCNHSTQI